MFPWSPRSHLSETRRLLQKIYLTRIMEALLMTTRITPAVRVTLPQIRCLCLEIQALTRKVHRTLINRGVWIRFTLKMTQGFMILPRSRTKKSFNSKWKTLKVMNKKKINWFLYGSSQLIWTKVSLMIGKLKSNASWNLKLRSTKEESYSRLICKMTCIKMIQLQMASHIKLRLQALKRQSKLSFLYLPKERLIGFQVRVFTPPIRSSKPYTMTLGWLWTQNARLGKLNPLLLVSFQTKPLLVKVQLRQLPQRRKWFDVLAISLLSLT